MKVALLTKKKLVLFYVFIFVCMRTLANDSSISIQAGSVSILDDTRTNISMIEEIINITLHSSHFEVTVDFTFYNDGPSEKILLGFPVNMSNFNTKIPENWNSIIEFESYINGKLITEYFIKDEINNLIGEIVRDNNELIVGFNENNSGSHLDVTRWFIREVVFSGNSYTYSRVTYKSPYYNRNFFGGGGVTLAKYIYGTGRSWKGNIGKMTVFLNHGDNRRVEYINFGQGEYYRRSNIHKPSINLEANGKYRFILNNMKPEKDEDIIVSVRGFSYNLSDESKYWHFYDDSDYQSDYIWNWDKNLLYEEFSDIGFYTKNQLRLFINTFYAHRGYEFQNPIWKNYFRKYPVNLNFKDSDFNDIERKNLNWLLNLEKMILDLEKD